MSCEGYIMILTFIHEEKVDIGMFFLSNDMLHVYALLLLKAPQYSHSFLYRRGSLWALRG